MPESTVEVEHTDERMSELVRVAIVDRYNEIVAWALQPIRLDFETRITPRWQERPVSFNRAMLAECDFRTPEIERVLKEPDLSGAVRVPATREIASTGPTFARPMVEERETEGFWRPAPYGAPLDLSPPAGSLEQAVFENLVREACLVRGGRWPEHRNADLRAAAEVICDELTATQFFTGYLLHLRAGFGADTERLRDVALENLRWALVRCRSEGRRRMWAEAVGCDLWPEDLG